jgi:hypothetical protein
LFCVEISYTPYFSIFFLLQIRETWGSRDHRSLLLFLFGAVTDAALNDRIIEENRMHDDIIQGNFIDAYRNMTYKHVMALKWFKYYCHRKPNFLLKTDDDVFVNTPFLYRSLENLILENQTIIVDSQKKLPLFLAPKNLILCKKSENLKALRYEVKWKVTYEEYNPEYYPPYCLGYAILYTADVVDQLYKKAQEAKYFWIDDVFVTGIVANELNISVTDGGDYFLTKNQMEDILANDNEKELKLEFLIARQDLTENSIKQLWSVVFS